MISLPKNKRMILDFIKEINSSSSGKLRADIPKQTDTLHINIKAREELVHSPDHKNFVVIKRTSEGTDCCTIF